MAGTGIILRTSSKESLIQDPPVVGEIVFANDTREIGVLGTDNQIQWSNLEEFTVAEREKLAAIENNANNYSLPVAGVHLGGVKSGTGISVDTFGNVTVKDNSHAHHIGNITGLSEQLSDLQTSINTGDAGLQTQIDLFQIQIDGKQDALSSTNNIKSINGQTILGSGDLVVNPTLVNTGGVFTWTDVYGNTSQFTAVNSVSGKTGDIQLEIDDVNFLQIELDAKQNNLISGQNLRTVNGNSLLGAGNVDLTTNLIKVGNELRYTNIDGTVQVIDLSLYLDDTNLAYITGGEYVAADNVLRFTRDDGSTFDVDASMFFDDTNLVTSVSGRTGDITIGINDVTNLQTSLNAKQDTLVSGTNIKSINGQTIIGAGDLDLSTDLSIVGNELRYTNIDGVLQTIDLSLYLDDTNLAYIISGEYVSADNVLRFTRSDDSTFDVDASMFFDDTNLVTSVAGKTGAVSLVKNDITDFVESDYAQDSRVDNIVAGIEEITYDNSNTNLIATTVKGALDEIRNTDYDKTLAYLQKSFVANETIDILQNEIRCTPSVTVAYEIPQLDQTSNTWQVNQNAYEFGDYALNTTIKPSNSISNGVFTLGEGSFTTENIGMRIVGNGGEAILIDVTGNYQIINNFNDTLPIDAGDWKMYALADVNNSLQLSSYNSGYDVLNAGGFNIVSSAVEAGAAVSWCNEGIRFYVVTMTEAKYYTATVPYDFSTLGTTATTFTWDISSVQSSLAPSLVFHPDGNKIYTMTNDTSAIIYEWDILIINALENGLQYLGVNQTISGGAYQETSVHGFRFNKAGTTIYIAGTTHAGRVTAIPMSEWDITTINAASANIKDLSSTIGLNGITGFEMSPDGKHMFLLVDNDYKVDQFTLTTPYDLTTATFYGSTTFGYQTNSTGLLLNFGGAQLASIGSNLTYFVLGEVQFVSDKYFPAVTSAVGTINTDFWTDINDITINETKNAQELYYAISNDDRDSWAVAQSGYGIRNIVRNNAGTWEYNNAQTSYDFIKRVIKQFNVTDFEHASMTSGRTLVALNGNNFGSYIILNKKGEIIRQEEVFNLNDSRNIIASKLGSDKVLIAYEDGGDSYKGKFIVIDDNGDILYNNKIFNNDETHELTAHEVQQGNVALAFRDSDDNGKFLIINESTSIVVTKKTFAYLPSKIDMTQLSSTNGVISWTDGVTGHGKFVVMNTAGSIIVPETTFNASQTISQHVKTLNNDNILFVFSDGSNNNYASYAIYNSAGSQVTATTPWTTYGVDYISAWSMSNGNTMITYKNIDTGSAYIKIVDEDFVDVLTDTVINVWDTNNIILKQMDDGDIVFIYNDFENSNYPVIDSYNVDGNKVQISGFNTNENWVTCTNNNEFEALTEAMSIEINRMDSIQAEAIKDWSQETYTLATELDLAVIFKTSQETQTPVYSGTVISYDGNVTHQYAHIGEEFNVEQFEDRIIRFTALIDGNFTIRVS